MDVRSLEKDGGVNLFAELARGHWYASPRNEDGSLFSGPVHLSLNLPLPVAEALVQGMKRDAAKRPACGDMKTLLGNAVLCATVLFDGQLIKEYDSCIQGWRPLPPCVVTFLDSGPWKNAVLHSGPTPRVLDMHVSRDLPLSSAHGNAPMVRK
jgi:hypothetical protein